MTAGLWIAIAVSALCTLLMRALPFLFFRGKRTMPGWLSRLGDALPGAMMAVLVVYCLKDGFATQVRTGIPQAISVLAVVASYKWKHKTLPSIVLGTAAYMAALRVMG